MEDAYKRLASMTSLENIRKWMEDAKAAQNNRETNVRSMDYFALNINKGIPICISGIVDA